MKKQILVHAVVTAMLGLSTSVMAADEAAPAMEKCYGVAKAGKNDCGMAGGGACATRSTKDRDPKAWIFVPKGTCEKIAGGNTAVGKT